MYFFIKDNELLEAYNDIWSKVSNSIKTELDCGPIYNKKFLKTETRSFESEVTDFHGNEIPKVDSNYTCLAVILINFVFKQDENYYLQAFFKKCKYIEKEKRSLDILLII